MPRCPEVIFLVLTNRWVENISVMFILFPLKFDMSTIDRQRFNEEMFIDVLLQNFFILSLPLRTCNTGRKMHLSEWKLRIQYT